MPENPGAALRLALRKHVKYWEVLLFFGRVGGGGVFWAFFWAGWRKGRERGRALGGRKREERGGASLVDPRRRVALVWRRAAGSGHHSGIAFCAVRTHIQTANSGLRPSNVW